MLCCVLLGLADGQFYPYPSGLLHRRWGNIIAPVPVKPPWRIWVNILHESSKNGDITTTKQSTIKAMHILWDVLNNPCWLLLLHVNTSQIQDGWDIITIISRAFSEPKHCYFREFFFEIVLIAVSLILSEHQFREMSCCLVTSKLSDA